MFDEEAEYDFWDQAHLKALAAHELYESGAMAKALSELDAAIKLNPSNSALHFNRAITLDAMEQFEDAIESYEDAIELTPDDPEILNAIAVDYTRTGRYDLALATFEQITEMYPEFEPSYCNRIITYTEIGDFEKAEEMFYLAQQINSNCPLCYYNIGNSLFTRNEYKRAIWCWSKTLELEPTHPQINYRIAQGHWAMGNHEQARRHFLSQIRNDPGDVEVILDYGIFLLERGEKDSAREKFNRILELSSEYAPAFFYLGELALGEGDIEKAAELYKKAMDLDYNYAGPRFRMALCSIRKGNMPAAAEYIKKELELGIDDPDVLLSMGSMLLQAGQTDAGINCVLQVLDLDEDHSQAYHYLAIASVMRGEFENALEFFDNALRLDSEEPELVHNIIRTYLLMNEVEKAHALMRQHCLGGKANAALRNHIRIKLLSTRARRFVKKALHLPRMLIKS